MEGNIIFAFLFLYIVGFAGRSGPGFNLIGTRGVFGSPISNYPRSSQFYTNDEVGNYYPNHGIRNVYQENIAPHKDVYEIFVFEDDLKNFRNGPYRYPPLSIIFNNEQGNRFNTNPVVDHDYIYGDTRNHNFFNLPEPSLKPNQLIQPTEYQEPQHIKNEPEKNYENVTTEPSAILGLPILISTSESNPDRVVFATSSETPSQKQCIQDCESSSAYSPVCGSNNVTFFNEEKFICARNCGINIYILKRGACT
ncbi:unnamed protein product [Parnassius apollo]|uniref:(apollo) hypothetical protein n=1 Tax=Parnassius apollo TaxID=110799 RepID=A0A8S3WZS2_PARAO|nr:unnamed protein product [Parnassius apollo]